MLTRKSLNWIILVALFAVLISACAPARTASNQGVMPVPEAAVERDNFNSAPYQGEAAQPAVGKPQAASIERLVIRNANLSLVVPDPGQSMEVINKMANEMGGYVVSQNLYKTSGSNEVEYPEGNISIRVPSDQLDQAMTQIKALVKNPVEDILSETVSGQDVTSEYTDLGSRLKNLQASEEQLREIMASAQKTEDVLAVLQQLTQVREQIEVIQGQMKYYEESARLSSISVSLKAEASVQPLKVGGWQPVGVARDAVQALIYTVQLIGTVAIWGLVYLLPVGLIIGLPIVLVIWLIRRGSKRRKAAAAGTVKPEA